MKKKNRLWNLLLMMELVLVLTYSCKKDETPSKKDSIITLANPADISFGTLLSVAQLNATADVPGTFVYTPTIGTKLNEGANQDLKVDFTPTDAATYSSASKKVKINVIASITVTDIDGNIYHTVIIGTQTWMTENLKVTHYRNGDPIPNITNNTDWDYCSTGAYCDYNNDVNNSTIYGRLYNWHACSDSRNIATIGWHVSTSADWYNLGLTNDAGGKLKEAGTSHWHSPNTGETNETGFTALPGGCRVAYDSSVDKRGIFYAIGSLGYWWSSGQYDLFTARGQIMFGDASNLEWFNYDQGDGLSVRCVKD